eukprot:GHVR01068090.1.p1 GENE.GHVR01068090.1~~GHVR01068090.1.p1  ORF type:complete len:603 (+),score=95.39 GHVR01068090.1:208-1809(+)
MNNRKSTDVSFNLLLPNDPNEYSPNIRPIRHNRASTIEEHDSRMMFLRQRYLHNLGHAKLVMMGFVPNLRPLLDPASLPHIPDKGAVTPPVFDLPSHSVMPSAPLSPTPSRPSEGNIPRAVSRPWLAPGSVKSSIFNLTSATLGAGALSIPYAVSGTGILCGLLLVAVTASLSFISTLYLVHVMMHTELKTLEDMAMHAYGHMFALFAEINIILFCFGTAVGYLISIADLASTMFNSFIPNPNYIVTIITSRAPLLCCLTAVLLLPLSLSDRLNDLRFTCFLGVAAIIFLTLMVMIRMAEMGVSPTLPTLNSILGPTDPLRLIRAVSLMTFAFSCQPNVPSIYVELEHRNARRMMKVSLRSIILCAFVYSIMGVGGFISFGFNTESNILNNYSGMLKEDMVVCVSFIGMAVAVIFAYPLNIFPCRFALEIMLFYSQPHLQGKKIYSNIIAVSMVVLSLILAIFVPQISLVFEFVGCTSGAFISFILPGLLYIRLLPGSLFHSRKLKAAFLVVFGCVIAVLGMSVCIYGLIHPA